MVNFRLLWGVTLSSALAAACNAKVSGDGFETSQAEGSSTEEAAADGEDDADQDPGGTGKKPKGKTVTTPDGLTVTAPPGAFDVPFDLKVEPLRPPLVGGLVALAGAVVQTLFATFSVVDESGHQSDPSPAGTVTVDLSPPTVASTVPTSGTITTTSATLT